MVYSKYFSAVLNQHGPINLNQDCTRALYNVISIEARIDLYRKLDKFKYGVEISKLEQKLRFLTGFCDPKVLLEIWYSGNLVKSNMTFDRSVNTSWQEDPYASYYKKRKT